MLQEALKRTQNNTNMTNIIYEGLFHANFEPKKARLSNRSKFSVINQLIRLID